MFVRGAECLGDLSRDRVPRQWARSLGDAIGQGRAIDLQHEGLRAGGIFEPIEDCDMRVVEMRGTSRSNRASRSGSGGEGGRIFSATSRLRRVSWAVHLAHATGADGRPDLIHAESRAWRERQRRIIAAGPQVTSAAAGDYSTGSLQHHPVRRVPPLAPSVAT